MTRGRRLVYITAGPRHTVHTPPPSSDEKQTNISDKMKSFVCIVLLAAAALAAPEGKRDKRGFLHGGYSSGLAYGHDFGYDDIHLGHGSLLDHAPARIISVNKVVEVPKVVAVKKIVSVPHVVSVPRVVKVSRVIEEPHVHLSYSHAPLSAGWW